MTVDRPEEQPVATIGGGSRRLLATNTIWSMLSEGVRMAAGLLVFFILTSRFDIGTYGRLIGTLAILHVVVPMATIGSGYLLLQRVAADGWDRSQALARAIGVALSAGTIVTVFLMLIQPILLPQVSVVALGLLGFSELALMGAVEACVFLAQATERLRTQAAIRAANGGMRLIAATIMLVTTSRPDLWVWAVYATLASAAGLVISQIFLLGRPLLPSAPTAEDVRSGLPFSLTGSAEKLRTGSDAFMLVRFDQPVEAGIYGAASRLLGAATTPIRALSQATNARAYEAGARSIRSAHRLALRLSGLALGWAIPLAAVLAIGGPTIVGLLPSEYAVAGDALQWMAMIPVLRVFQTYNSTALTVTGYNGVRVQLTLWTAVANVGLNAILIPDHGWRGAVSATIITSTVYGVCAWFVLFYLTNRERRAESGVVG